MNRRKSMIKNFKNMKFKYNAIGNNTVNNRDWLINLGYKYFISKDGKKLFSIGSDLETSKSFTEEDTSIFIDCTNNNRLFKAITAIHQESDYMQWFTNGIDWCKCHTETFNHFLYHENKEDSSINLIGAWHKAGVEELINMFK